MAADLPLSRGAIELKATPTSRQQRQSKRRLPMSSPATGSGKGKRDQGCFGAPEGMCAEDVSARADMPAIHSASQGATRAAGTLLLTASVRFRTLAGGFLHSPQRLAGKTWCVAPPRSSADDSILALVTNIEARSLKCANLL